MKNDRAISPPSLLPATDGLNLSALVDHCRAIAQRQLKRQYHMTLCNRFLLNQGNQHLDGFLAEDFGGLRGCRG
jgi:hypothetical protein